MHTFEFLPDGDTRQIRLSASTFAGLMTAGLQGLCAAIQPIYVMPEVTTERVFSFVAKDSASMLLHFLSYAREQGAAHGEAYDAVRFTLVTPTKVDGTLLGKKMQAVANQVLTVLLPSGSAAKNEQGQWETVVEMQ